jgi:hypothetical protein
MAERKPFSLLSAGKLTKEKKVIIVSPANHYSVFRKPL